MSVGDRDVNSGLFPAQQENTTCLCVSVTKMPLSLSPPCVPESASVTSIAEANGDMLNHSTLLHHTHSHVPLADSLETTPFKTPSEMFSLE